MFNQHVIGIVHRLFQQGSQSVNHLAAAPYFNLLREGLIETDETEQVCWLTRSGVRLARATAPSINIRNTIMGVGLQKKMHTIPYTA